ncbi:MAG TPA: helix-turn-helix domain-containing protein [Candidatus Dormibacteraeota bacterium]|nr:helix-turn-helix domain-containing protein [Candidatus Dormibacteraeota bacterium]
MDGRVKERRYDASSRQARSAETRQRILATARELILARGYRATTVAAIASGAGVNVDTVYELVGRKPVLLRALIERAISGGDEPVAAQDREYVKAIRAEPDAARKLAIYATAVRRIQERMAPLFMSLRDASSTEPEARAVWREISERRAVNMRLLVRDLREAGGLRRGLSVDAAADMVWALNSSEMFVLLTVDRGWSPKRFERWLADTWCRLLLP